ncbi:uncharacterized protein G2W53_044512 [Senna tora]|uniref:Uncharacterized protein n=1 Tax=Senna tora TaxID=362788 RepID=A0A834SCG0_9FABA|nr:uncharacterized protein G2W53_044512 [Senna tora]
MVSVVCTHQTTLYEQHNGEQSQPHHSTLLLSIVPYSFSSTKREAKVNSTARCHLTGQSLNDEDDERNEVK